MCNFADVKAEWLYSLAEIRRRCEEIASREPKGFDFWCLESCLYQKYGIKELMMVITIPFYQIKLHCLQEMMRVVEGVSVKRRKRRRAWRLDGAALRISWRLWRNAEIRLRMLRMRTI